MPAMPLLEAVDVFCGVGGLTYGLRRAGIKVRAGIDIDKAAHYPYEKNNKSRFVLEDVRNTTGADLRGFFSRESIRLIAGCAPCQPFSTLSRKPGAADAEKWGLLVEFGRLVEEVRPELVTMENVIRIVHHSPYERFLDVLERAGYWVYAGTVRCADYGLGQDRRRHVLMASLFGPIALPPGRASRVTVRDVIGNLPPVLSGGVDPSDRLHCARALNPVNLKRIAASRPGGTWLDWPEPLRAPCHRTKSGESFKSVYGRMAWDQPAPTITTMSYNFGAGRFGHPEQDRALTLREAALLQSFPEKYIFARPDEPILFSSLGRLIGNAVPPLLGEVIGRAFKEHVDQHGQRSR